MTDQDPSSRELPSGFSEVRKANLSYTLTQNDLPWIADQQHDLSLVRVSLQGGGEFLFGSAIRNRNLLKAAEGLDEHRKKITDNLLYAHLPDLVRQGYSPSIKTVDNGVSKKAIHYVGNKGGQRVYFMRFDNVDGLPVIIRVAVCDKSEQMKVLKVLTSSQHQRLKQISGL